MAAKEALADAQGTVELLSALGTLVAGPAAAMMDAERAAIERPLARIYQRNAAISAAVGRFADPLALVGALGAYGMRVWFMRQIGSAAALAPAPTDYPTAIDYGAETNSNGGGGSEAERNAAIHAILAGMER